MHEKIRVFAQEKLCLDEVGCVDQKALKLCGRFAEHLGLLTMKTEPGIANVCL